MCDTLPGAFAPTGYRGDHSASLNVSDAEGLGRHGYEGCTENKSSHLRIHMLVTCQSHLLDRWDRSCLLCGREWLG